MTELDFSKRYKVEGYGSAECSHTKAQTSWVVPSAPIRMRAMLGSDNCACLTAYATCANIALQRGTDALERWCNKYAKVQ